MRANLRSVLLAWGEGMVVRPRVPVPESDSTLALDPRGTSSSSSITWGGGGAAALWAPPLDGDSALSLAPY